MLSINSHHLLFPPYLWTPISSSHIGVISTTIFGAGTTHFAFSDVQVGLVHPAQTAASTRNSKAAT